LLKTTHRICVRAGLANFECTLKVVEEADHFDYIMASWRMRTPDTRRVGGGA
jgi:hypothetical protein